MPLQRRIPKRGFTNIHRVEYQVVNLRDLSRVEAGEVTPQVLKAAGLVRNLSQPVKILGTGDVEGAYQISAHAFSKTAREKIEGAGGSVTLLGVAEEDAGTEEAAPKAKGKGKAKAAPAAEAAPEAAESEEAPAPAGDEASEAEDEKA